MKKRHAIRWNMWWTEGKKDGMCSTKRAAGDVPRLYRQAYDFGHTYGMLMREEIHAVA